MSKEIIKYSNKLNNIPLKNFEKVDLNFFYAICAKVREKGSELVEIPLDEIKVMTEYKSTSVERFKSDLIRMNEKLRSCHGIYETDDEIVQFNLFSTFTIVKSRKVLKIRLNPDVAWLLNNIAKEFTSFELQEYVSLDGIYAKALYRLLKQWKTHGCTKKYGVSELKELLSIPDYETRRFLDKIINPAVDEINKSGAFKNLRCEVIHAKKRGRPVEGYVFHFDLGDLSGQISFSDLEEFDEIVDGMTHDEKAALLNAANNIIKSKKRKKNAFSENCSRRRAASSSKEKRYQELLERALLGALTSDEQEEFERLSAERSSK
jgi:plasmid replication initiation protein